MVMGHIKKVLIGKIERGKDLYKSLVKIISDNNIESGIIFLLGALDRVNVGYYDLIHKRYINMKVSGLFEIASGLGNIAVKDDGNPVLHVHIVAQDKNGRTVAGHLLEGCRVGIVVEYHVLEIDKKIRRKYDNETGLLVME